MYSFLTYLLLVITPSVHDLAFNSLVVNQTDRILSRGKWSPYVFSFIHTFVPVPGMSDGFPDSESELYEIYLDAMTEMPMANLERISNPVSWWQVRQRSIIFGASKCTWLSTDNQHKDIINKGWC